MSPIGRHAEHLQHRLSEGAALLGLPPAPERDARLLRYLELLARWSRAFNLTAVRDPDAMLVHHLLDSLAVAPHLVGSTVLDLGTGAGLPGIPLAIAEPGRTFTLLDGNGKKVRFVRQAVLELAIANALPVQSRVETYRPERNFSTIVVRAVASAAQIASLASCLLATPGHLLIMKGRYPADELADPGLAGLDLSVHPLRVPFLEGERHLIEIRLE